MSQQPKALELAEWCEANSSGSYSKSADAAAELRRLHALNQELAECLSECVEDTEDAIARHIEAYGEKYRAQRLEFLREQVKKARAAIAQATP